MAIEDKSTSLDLACNGVQTAYASKSLLNVKNITFYQSVNQQAYVQWPEYVVACLGTVLYFFVVDFFSLPYKSFMFQQLNLFFLLLCHCFLFPGFLCFDAFTWGLQKLQ